MEKVKYAFIMNSAEQTPENYSTTIDSDLFHVYACAVNSLEMACDLAKKLTEDGYTLIDLCGDFDDEKTGTIQKTAGTGVKVCHARFTPAEEDKYNIYI